MRPGRPLVRGKGVRDNFQDISSRLHQRLIVPGTILCDVHPNDRCDTSPRVQPERFWVTIRAEPEGTPSLVKESVGSLVVEAGIRLGEDRHRRFAGPSWFDGPANRRTVDHTAKFADRPAEVRQTPATADSSHAPTQAQKSADQEYAQPEHAKRRRLGNTRSG